MLKPGKPAPGKTPTIEKIAFQTGAAKDELFASAISEDQTSVVLNVLANDPGSATLYSLAQGITSISSQVQALDSVTLGSGAVIRIENGVVRYDISAVNHHALALGEVAVESFEYVIRMGNGALSTATASVEIIGLNDAPTLAALPADPILVQDSVTAETERTITGRLQGHDVDNGAVLTYGFAHAGEATRHDDGTVSIATAYGRLVLDSGTGEYTFTVDAAALEALGAEEEILLGFDVFVRDEHGAGSNVETIQFRLVGADETHANNPPQFGDVTTFVINHGLNIVNGRGFIDGFDGNDKLKLAAVKQMGDIYHVDTDNDGKDDSSALFVQFLQGNKGGNGVEIVLTGYLGLSQDQIESSAN